MIPQRDSGWAATNSWPPISVEDKQMKLSIDFGWRGIHSTQSLGSRSLFGTSSMPDTSQIDAHDPRSHGPSHTRSALAPFNSASASFLPLRLILSLQMPFVHLGTPMPFRKAEDRLSPPAASQLPPPCIFNRHTRAADK